MFIIDGQTIPDLQTFGNTNLIQFSNSTQILFLVHVHVSVVRRCQRSSMLSLCCLRCGCVHEHSILRVVEGERLVMLLVVLKGAFNVIWTNWQRFPMMGCPYPYYLHDLY